MKGILITALLYVFYHPGAAQDPFYNIMDYGAVNDGKTVNTRSIQKAIDACAASGGGTVYFPAGTFISGTIRLKSHINLHLEAGAILKGSKDTSDYPVIIPELLNNPSYRRSLVYGEGLRFVSITGQGTIDGNQASYLEHLEDLMVSDRGAWNRIRPYNVRFSDCEHVVLKDITLVDACAWCIHLLACRNVHVDGITVNNIHTSNRDGIDIDACEYIRISNCDVTSGDDALVLFTSLPGRPCKNVTITNCFLSSRCHAFKLYNSRGTGIFRNISITNCILHNTKRAGISLQMADGCELDNLTVSDIIMDQVNCPVWIQQWKSTDHDPTRPGKLSNMIFSNIQATGADSIGCILTGLPGYPLQNITLSNIRISFSGGGTKELSAREIGELPELGNKTYYHQRINNHDQFGMLPAYGFFVRHVDVLVMENIDLSYQSADHRPALHLEDVHHSRLTGIRASHEDGIEPLIVTDRSSVSLDTY